MDKYLLEQFKNPGADKRSLPFWAWNDKMDLEELKRQVRLMKQAGVGGFFMHSRIGLETEYLGKEWMECVKAVVAEAKEQGLYAWLYDEDRWPSGTAGGRVTSCGDAYRCKGLTLEVLSPKDYAEIYRKEILRREHFTDETIGLVAAYRAVLGYETEGKSIPEELPSTQIPPKQNVLPMSIVSFKRLTLAENEVFAENEVLLVVRLEVSAPSEWFNNEAPPDNLNPDCVRKFIEETHEKYKEVVGQEFGRTVRGIFTDEPSLNDRFCYFGEHKSWIPWTYGFGNYFSERMGYDFWEKLPFFYFHGEESAQIRHDYWCCITKRFGESYFKTISEWCEENQLLFTGHLLQEDKMGLCARVNGGVMPHYQYLHVPGIDMLCEQTKEYLTVKQCTSVAHQLGKKQVLSETYGCTGWEFTFEGQKWMGDWQFALGVNRRCQHLALYSLRGCRKRDYPPSFNYNTNWWNENKIVDDYFARLSTVLEQGEAVRNILLLHPMATVWTHMGVDPYGNPVRRKERDVPELNAYGDCFNELIKYLEHQHLDCDLGDELLIGQYGSVIGDCNIEEGAAEEGTFFDGTVLGKAQFRIGQANYRAVVLPPLDTLEEFTGTLLLEFMKHGGRVYFLMEGANKLPEKGILKELVMQENCIIVASKEELAGLLLPYRTIKMEEYGGQECTDVLYQLRKKGKEYYLFLVNNNRNRAIDVVVRLPFAAIPTKMELLTGETLAERNYENGVDGLRLPLKLSKAGSALFYLRTLQTRKQSVAGPFVYRLSGENVLLLDCCRYRLAEDAWSDKQEVWQVQKLLREQLGMRPNHYNGIEQRYKWITRPHPRDGQKMELLFTFWADREVTSVSLAMERPEDFAIKLNGNDVLWESAGWFLDKAMEKCMLPEIKQGENHLLLSCNYRNDMELENIYLVGNFGVDAAGCLTQLPSLLPTGDWTEHGLKHYCGSVIYELEYVPEETPESNSAVLPKTWLRLPKIKAVCVKVRVNAFEILLPWDFERDISIEKWLRLGNNHIEVEVIGSPRNMMGPFHIKEKPSNTNDACFCPTPEKYTDAYLLEPYGLMGDIVIVQTVE